MSEFLYSNYNFCLLNCQLLEENGAQIAKFQPQAVGTFSCLSVSDENTAQGPHLLRALQFSRPHTGGWKQ